MSEKRFLGFVFIEGVLLTILSLGLLILPKLTFLSFGVALSSVFIIYGIYKIVTSIINRNYVMNIIWNIFLGVFITLLGFLLLLVPKVSLIWLISLIGVYFLLESVSATAFVSYIKNVFNLSNCKYLSAMVLFFTGLIIILGIPTIAFWLVTLLSGLAFLVKGMSKITIFLANKNNYNI